MNTITTDNKNMSSVALEHKRALEQAKRIGAGIALLIARTPSSSKKLH